MRNVFIICSFLYIAAGYAAAVLIPVYITPGYYWWSVFFMINNMIASQSFTTRMNTFV